MCTAELNESQKDCHSFGSPVNFLMYNFGNFALKAWVETPGLLWSGSLDSFSLVWHRCNLTRPAWIWARNSSDSSTCSAPLLPPELTHPVILRSLICR